MDLGFVIGRLWFKMVSKTVNEIVIDAIDLAMQALLQARFSDLPVVDMKEILQQRMFKDKSYEAHEDHKKLYDALEKSLERDYSDQILSDLEEAPTGTSGSTQQQGSKALSSSKSAALAPQYVHFSDDEDSGNDHLPIADSRKGWWKPLPAKERLVTPEPTWTIHSSNVSDVKNNWATTLALTYVTPAENSLLVKTGDMTNFLNWYCHQVGWANPEGDQVKIDVNRPLPLGAPSGYVTIQSQFFFNKDLEYLIRGRKGSSPTLSISKMKAASYLNVDMNLYRVKKKSDHTCGFSVLSELKPTQDTGHLDHLPGSDKKMISTAVKLCTRNLVIRQRVEDIQLSIESYQTHLNLTKPGWDATGYEFKHDYTIIEFPRAVMFSVNNNE
nr:hypothetical protein [Tanacetum cinerariifolium]